MKYTREQIAWAVENAGMTILGGDGVQPLDVLIDAAREAVYLRAVNDQLMKVIGDVEARQVRPIVLNVTSDQAQALISMPKE